jgi:hypothetical protein
MVLFGPRLNEMSSVSIVNFSTLMEGWCIPSDFRASSSNLHDDGGSRFLHNTDNCLPDYMVSETEGHDPNLHCHENLTSHIAILYLACSVK